MTYFAEEDFVGNWHVWNAGGLSVACYGRGSRAKGLAEAEAKRLNHK